MDATATSGAEGAGPQPSKQKAVLKGLADMHDNFDRLNDDFDREYIYDLAANLGFSEPEAPVSQVRQWVKGILKAMIEKGEAKL